MLAYKDIFQYDKISLNFIEISNYRSIRNGVLEFKGNKTAEHNNNIVCVYGPNGSGKTSAVEILQLFKTLVRGSSIDQEIYSNCITCGCDKSHLLFEFEGFLSDNDLSYKRQLVYEFDIVKLSDSDDVTVKNEVLRIANIDTSLPKEKALLQLQPIFDTIDSEFVGEGKLPFGPKSKIGQLIECTNYNELQIIKNDSYKTSRSFVFNSKTLRFLVENNYFGRVINEDDGYKSLLGLGVERLFMASSEIEPLLSDKYNNPVCIFFGSIFELKRFGSSCIEIPNFIDKEYIVESGFYSWDLNNDKKEFSERGAKALLKHIEELNSVLPHLMNCFCIEAHETADDTKPDKKTIALFGNYGTRIIPLNMISDSEKKIICLLSLLYNSIDSNHLIVIDDFDTGLFTSALCEIMKYIDFIHDDRQFILMMHNPIAIDLIAKESIVFATSNEDDRFSRAKQVKASNSLMKLYLDANPKVGTQLFDPVQGSLTPWIK